MLEKECEIMTWSKELTNRFDELTKDREKAKKFYRNNWASVFLVDEEDDVEAQTIAWLTSMIIAWLIKTAEIKHVGSDYNWRDNSNLITIDKYSPGISMIVGEIGYDIVVDKKIIVVK